MLEAILVVLICILITLFFLFGLISFIFHWYRMGDYK